MACKRKLKNFGLAVLVGQQGSGKTSTAIHIMTDVDYLDWKKMNLTSWEDLLAFEFEDSTLIYIDNLFDGFLYYQHVDYWWDSLIYFYFECIRRKSNIRLMITAKETEIKRACAYFKENIQIFSQACFVREYEYPLSNEEKIDILKCHIKSVNPKNGMASPFISEKLTSEIKDIICPIGFPLCAHMYAYEEKHRDISIFWSPRTYVRNQILHRIRGDDTGGVKTLFLFLIYCSSLAPSHSLEIPELQYSRECESFLRNLCPDSFMEKMHPVSFQNLREKAEELIETVLIRPNRTFQFKHQIYLEGAIDYFFRENFDAFVDLFPLSFLRTCEMQDVSEEQISKLISRMIKEIVEGAISETLSCKIFEDSKFEKEFCNNIKEEEQMMHRFLFATDEKSSYKLPLIFWANKYNLFLLSKTLMDFPDENDREGRQQFFFALFGELCSYDENFIKRAKQQQEMKYLPKLVLKFKLSDGKTVSHIILSSKRSDNDAFQCFKRILNEAQEHETKLDKSIIDCVLKQNKYSRLQCLLHVLQNVHKNAVTESLYIRVLVNELKTAYTTKDRLLELEMLCRISILVVHSANGFTRKYRRIFFNDRKDYPIPISLQKERFQNLMADRINNCIQCFNGTFPKREKTISFELGMTEPLEKAVQNSIAILAGKEDTFSPRATFSSNAHSRDSEC